MSAANASVAPSPSLQDETRAHEPSMEEILASIRRIIADDQTLPGNRRDREERRRRAAEEDESVAAPQKGRSASAEVAPHFVEDDEPEATPAEVMKPQTAAVADIHHLRLNRAAEQAAPVGEIDEPEVEDYEEPAETVSADEEPVLMGQDALLSADTETSVASHFQALAASMILNDSGVLQQYAQEMLRPMLKQWLDDNLPVIVERLVRAEIERVARGGRR